MPRRSKIEETFDEEMILEEEKSDDESVYSEGDREDMMDNDSISAEEDAFMRGYEDA